MDFLTPLVSLGSNGPATRVDEGIACSCGAAALSILCRLENRPLAVTDVGACLPNRANGSYSLLELRDASSALGLELRGVRLARADLPLKFPALVYLARKPDGHFIVVRPVGHTGKLVQTLDPTDGVRVIDAEALFSSPEWTGDALIPVRSAETFALRRALVALVLTGFLGLLLAKRRRTTRHV